MFRFLPCSSKIFLLLLLLQPIAYLYLPPKYILLFFFLFLFIIFFFLLYLQARISGSDAEIEKVIEKKAKELDSVLPKLFISTAYLDWLEKQEMEHPESALPIPYYLKKKKKMSKRK